MTIPACSVCGRSVVAHRSRRLGVCAACSAQAGRESVYAEIDADVAQIARNAAKSIDVIAARRRAGWSR